MGIWQLNRTYRNLQRFQSILNVLLKNGFGYLVRDLGLHRLLPLGKQASLLRSEDHPVTDQSALPQRFRMVLEELGPTFIKFGQVLSTRPDMIPASFVMELKKLREEVTPLPAAMVRRQIMSELGTDFTQIFAEFDEDPIAAASIAQVHTARLLTGDSVVIKVMRPGIEKVIQDDLSILRGLAKLLDKHIPEIKQIDPIGLVAEFEKTILKELDFTIEAANTHRFRSNFEGDPDLLIPKVFWDYSTKKILMLERIHGIGLDRIDRMKEQGLDVQLIARKGMRLFLQQVIQFGFFHADPHPGNVFVLEDGRLGLVDFGMVGRIEDNARRHLSQLILALVNQNYDRIINALRDLGFEIEDEHFNRVRSELRELIEIYYGLPIQKIHFSDVFSRILTIVIQFGIKAPPDFLVLSRALMVSEGIARQLDPDLDVIEICRPIVRDLISKGTDPGHFLMETAASIQEMRRNISSIPSQMHAIASKLLKGKLSVEFSHANLDPLYKEIERLGNRIAFGLVIASIILGSSLIILSNRGPYLAGYPALGVIGYFIAGIIGFWLIISIIRSGKL